MDDGLGNDDIEDRFFIHGRMEILDILNDLIHRQEPVSVKVNRGRDAFVTTLLEARSKALIFDLAGDADANSRLLACRACVFVAHPEGILVQFSGGQVRRLSWGGTDALCVRLPRTIARLQRQESFRILIAAAQAPMVGLFAAGGAGLGEWPLHDLSIGGIGVSAIGEPPPDLGRTIARIHVALPDHGEIDCAATLRHVTCVANDENQPRHRIGLTFSALPPAMGVMIQRYIIQVAHERRAAALEHGAGSDN